MAAATAISSGAKNGSTMPVMITPMKRERAPQFGFTPDSRTSGAQRAFSER